ncbi:MAG: hypothetical protein EON58_01310 [Alphaproteobacteria bacterium]|nr:MAG: hypothetical protein EON58_01310 [Alphaproteobacteria bacterium]
MANCIHCGRDAGYLKSICNTCFENGPSVPGVSAKQERPLILQGLQGKTLKVLGDNVQIAKSAGPFAERREKTIPLRQITSVEVKKPSKVVGFIQFSIAGGKAHDSSFTISGGAFAAAGDENSVTFLETEAYAVALQIKAYVESWQPQQTAAPTQASAADELLKFASLLDRGLLTREEFDAKKKQLLGV